MKKVVKGVCVVGQLVEEILEKLGGKMLVVVRSVRVFWGVFRW